MASFYLGKRLELLIGLPESSIVVAYLKLKFIKKDHFIQHKNNKLYKMHRNSKNDTKIAIFHNLLYEIYI